MDGHMRLRDDFGSCSIRHEIYIFLALLCTLKPKIASARKQSSFYSILGLVRSVIIF